MFGYVVYLVGYGLVIGFGFSVGKRKGWCMCCWYLFVMQCVGYGVEYWIGCYGCCFGDVLYCVVVVGVGGFVGEYDIVGGYCCVVGQVDWVVVDVIE